MKLLSLSLASLEWLFEDRGLTVAEASPLSFMTVLPLQSAAAQRAQTATAEGLAAGGQLSDGYGEAIDILARPGAQVGLTLVAPSRAMGGASYFTRGGRAVQFHVRPEGCTLGRPVNVDSVATGLAELLTGPGPLEGSSEATLSARVLAILTALWPMSEREMSKAVPREEALTRLGASPMAANAAAVLAELVHAKILRAANREFTIHPSWRPWLESAWSGHLCQLSYLPLPATGRPDRAHTKYVVSSGPPGRRLRSRHMSGEELAQRSGSSTPPEAGGPVIQLTSLTAEAAQSVVRQLLALPRPA